jgi:hypothetical protein
VSASKTATEWDLELCFKPADDKPNLVPSNACGNSYRLELGQKNIWIKATVAKLRRMFGGKETFFIGKSPLTFIIYKKEIRIGLSDNIVCESCLN